MARCDELLLGGKELHTGVERSASEKRAPSEDHVPKSLVVEANAGPLTVAGTSEKVSRQRARSHRPS